MSKRLLLVPLVLALVLGCKNEEETSGDADADMSADLTTDPTGDPVPDGVEDPTGDPTPDPTGDPTPDPTEDPTPDPTGDEVADASMDPADDASDDAEDAWDWIDEDASSSIYWRYAKGPRISTGPCNPAGTTTEEIVAVAHGSGCVGLTHYCAWMNNCSTLSSTYVHTPPRTITITETETGSMCYGEGYFNPEYGFCGLAPGVWTFWIGSLSTTVTVT
jgi:hypothetical protein